MKHIKNLNEITEPFAITIGNFDGVHLGHQSLISDLKNQATAKSLKTCVVSFLPHPKLVFDPNIENYLINNQFEKEEMLRNTGVDYYIEIVFSRDFSQLKASEFVNQILLSNSHLKMFLMGYDFVFGSDRKGDFKSTSDLLSAKGIIVKQANPYKLKEVIVSSSIVRNKIISGHIGEANKFLGRNYFIEGVVLKGQGKGRKIGFPTANIDYKIERLIPQKGVYITYTESNGMKFQSVTNIGNNPTFNFVDRLSVESHILDFDKFIYGESVKIEFLEKIRDEISFSSVNDLITQINKDVQTTSDYFKKNV